MDKTQILQRRRRARRMERLVIITVTLLILLPAILCILLYVRVCSMQKQIDELNDKNAFTQTKLVQVEKSITLAINNALGQQQTPGDVTLNIVGEGSQNETTAGDAKDDQNEKTAYLTFDDGPSENTEKILNILQEYGVKATFFVTGKTDSKSKEMYKRIVEEGHTLGMHSYSHKYSEIYKSVDAFAADIKKLQDYLEEVTGVKPMLYRFPGGSSNKVSNTDMKQFIAYLNKEGIVYFDWNVASGDAQGKEKKAKTLVNNVMKDVNAYKNSVILMHDASNKNSTVEALPEIIKQLRQQGFVISAIDDTVEPVQHISADTVEAQ